MTRLSMYSPLSTWKQGDLPTSPFVYIGVGTYTREGEHILLSSQLMSDIEIDEAVAILKRDLEEFSKAAKVELQKLRQRMSAK